MPGPPPASPWRDPRALYWEAARLLEAGEFDAAEAAFLRYAAESTTRAADGYAGAGRAAWRLRGKREIAGMAEADTLPPEARGRAIGHYRRALVADPDHGRSMEGLAHLLGPTHPERLALLRRAAELSNSPDVLLLLGEDLARAHDLDGAVAAYEAAVNRDARDPRAYQSLAELNEMMGRAGDARRWRRTLSERFGGEGRDNWAKKRRQWQADAEIPEAPVWCVVANVAPEHLAGPYGSEVRRGTKHFVPGAKVYVFPPQWGDGGAHLEVVGHHRGSKRFVSVIVPAKVLRNARAKCVYSPYLIREVRRYWDGSDTSKSRAEDLARALNDGVMR